MKFIIEFYICLNGHQDDLGNRLTEGTSSWLLWAPPNSNI